MTKAVWGKHTVLMVGWLLSLSLGAWAQNAQQVPPPGPGNAQPSAAVPVAPAPQAQSAPVQAFPVQPPPGNRPGFIYEFGRWWEDARGKLDGLGKRPDDGVKDAAQATQDAVKNAAQATKDAVTAIVRLPSARVVEVRARCEPAPNGAPDCRTAAAKVCRGKGFGGGDPIDVRSSENCPPSVLISGRQPAAGECPTETVVLGVVCH